MLEISVLGLKSLRSELTTTPRPSTTEPTTRSTVSRFKFKGRSTTPRSVTKKPALHDQTLEPSNQKSRTDNDFETSILDDLSLAIHTLQGAPIRGTSITPQTARSFAPLQGASIRATSKSPETGRSLAPVGK